MYRTLTLVILAGAALGVAGCSRSGAPNNAGSATATAPAAMSSAGAMAPMTSATATSSVAPGTVAAAATGPNPLLTPSPLSFHAPEFAKIESGDFAPAIEKGMAEQLQEVQAIANNPAPPTFQNTLVAMEQSGQDLNRTMMVFGLLTSANTNPILQKTQREMAPKLAAHRDAIFLDQKLWQRVKAIWDKRDSLKLGPEDQRLLTVYHRRFVHAGANLNAADRAKLKELNQKAASLSAAFVQKLLAGTKHGALVVSDQSKLAGLSDAQIKAAAKQAEERGLTGKWVIPLQNTTQQPDLALLKDRDVRHELFMHSWDRTAEGKYSTREIIAKLAKTRAEKADLLGYPNYAAWKLVTQMAKTPEKVNKFLEKLAGPVKATAKDEAKELQQLIDASGKSFKLEPWDWEYYAEKLREKKYDINQDELKQYFELDNVLQDGVFYAAHKLYGISFKERHDLPVWAPDVHVYEVYDADGSPLALFYTDYFKRDNKGGGAWMSELRGQSKLLGTLPVVYNVANFPPPAPGKPALLTFDDVTTMFHEFGHALNGFFSDVKYPSLSGTAHARDFVEFPSQFNEHWALYPEIFEHYAINYKTGKPMPKALREKMKKARFYNAGYDMMELVEAAALDMKWHELPASAPLQKPGKFGPKALKEMGLYMEQVPPRYRSSYFMHIWGNGYAAGYYAYLWTERLADDGFQWFLVHGGLTRQNGDRYRNLVLSRGSSVDPVKMWREFYGGPPKIGPMLKFRGLSGTSAAAAISASAPAAATGG